MDDLDTGEKLSINALPQSSTTFHQLPCHLPALRHVLFTPSHYATENMGRVGWKITKMPAKSPCAPRVPAGWEQKEKKGTSADEPDPNTHSDTRWFPIHHDPLPSRHALPQPEATTWATTSTPNPARTIDEAIVLGEKVIKLAQETALLLNVAESPVDADF